jgi:hypothetical protein
MEKENKEIEQQLVYIQRTKEEYLEEVLEEFVKKGELIKTAEGKYIDPKSLKNNIDYSAVNKRFCDIFGCDEDGKINAPYTEVFNFLEQYCVPKQVYLDLKEKLDKSTPSLNNK